MYPWTHFIYALIFALIGIKSGLISVGLGVVLVLFSVFIDIDHLLFYHIHTKKWNLFKAWNYCIKHPGIRFEKKFHNLFFVECVLLLGIVLYFVNIGWSFVLIAGYFTHYLLDYLHIKLVDKNKHHKIRLFGLDIRIGIYELILDAIAIVILIVLL